MRSPRKEPRINIRFDNIHLMDRIELFANKRGHTLQNWIRFIVMREISEDYEP